MVWPKSLLDVCYTVALLYDGSSSSFVRLCCDYCHISVYFLKNQLAILVMKMEEKATFWTYYALLKKGKNTTETHTEYLCSV